MIAQVMEKTLNNSIVSPIDGCMVERMVGPTDCVRHMGHAFLNKLAN